jgi:hypothetical protein
MSEACIRRAISRVLESTQKPVLAAVAVDRGLGSKRRAGSTPRCRAVKAQSRYGSAGDSELVTVVACLASDPGFRS